MIRKFTRTDLTTCITLLIKAYDGEPWNFHWREKAARQYLTEIIENKGFAGFVYIENKNITGALLGHKRTWWTGVEFSIDELFVDPAYQGKGYGQKLIDATEQHVRSEGIGDIVLLTDTRFPAKRFYEKNKFQPQPDIIFMSKHYT